MRKEKPGFGFHKGFYQSVYRGTDWTGCHLVCAGCVAGGTRRAGLDGNRDYLDNGDCEYDSSFLSGVEGECVERGAAENGDKYLLRETGG